MPQEIPSIDQMEEITEPTYGGGVEIAIRQELAQPITTINRVGSRILLVTLQRQESQKPITTIVPYAPNQGHAKQEQRPHFGKGTRNHTKYTETTHNTLARRYK